MNDRIRTKRQKPEGKGSITIINVTIKPKSAEPVPEMEELDAFEDRNKRDKIAEKLSISVPVQPLQRPTGLSRYIGKNVRILYRDGNVTTGFLQGRSWDYLHILNFTETGKGEKLTGSWCGVSLNSISRVYPADVKVEKVSEQ